MIEFEHEINSYTAGDGRKLHYREWPKWNPVGIVVCLHGIRSHSAWYMESCAYLNKKGYRVLFPDRRGSGLNREIGFSGFGYDIWIKDIEELIKQKLGRVQNIPVHLMGISWGGRLAVVLAEKRGIKVKSLILSAPGLSSLIDFPAGKKARILLSAFFSAEKMFPVPLEDPALFTNDPDEQNYIMDDKLSKREAEAGYLLESWKLEKEACRSLKTLSLPVFLMLAGRDRIVDNDEVKKMFSSCKSSDKLLKIYPVAAHTLEFDYAKEEYFGDILKWLERHSGAIHQKNARANSKEEE
jgi:alpha-beta hydrolase superfamily lysophospholipase